MQRSICIFFIATALLSAQAKACDLCGCYTPQLETMPQAGNPSAAAPESWLQRTYFAVAEQFTHFGTLQFDGREVANPTDQHEESSITQLVAGYEFTPQFALQLNVPLIYRSFERPEGFEIDRGSESGLGDISLVGRFVLFHKEIGGRRSVNFEDAKNPRMEIHEPDLTISAVAFGGVKLPTGGTSRIKEEFEEVEIPGAPESGIHGHDLTLGSGSYDGILGGQTSLRYKWFFFEAEMQFTLRGDGAHVYRFANDLTWSGGPGYYFVRKADLIIGVQAACTGEHKDLDRFRGEAAEDTGITSVFVGPRVVVSAGKISGELAAEIPVSIENTALQIVPDYRLKASLAIRF